MTAWQTHVTLTRRHWVALGALLLLGGLLVAAAEQHHARAIAAERAACERRGGTLREGTADGREIRWCAGGER